ncbi:G_PROTEIN_RECEP_F1_2 domain-containing protein [Meloidogyne graminicola]|uniref:G_PROTEIN_RECEP_F1_2 domain-containing protein n=1 Tax=Meloidogyne graminicola TaxID=189291 RepID=A0A8S9ZQN9_9BILA|nr:G_PROTEIN_RECEP_F1_2 domain-containing protein [Meloidogyne graminicola]
MFSASFGLALFLGIINLLVVCGNLAVLYIILTQKSLHTSTNTIVFSLTLSDFLLGCLILPFSITQEFSNSWDFGTLWCKSWLSLDILLSTASIYNLLAISFDRYMAIKHPMKYGRLISSSRLTKFNISSVWLISASLAVPPFLSDLFMVTTNNEQMNNALILLENNYSETFLQFKGTCTPVTNSDFYILFSATISFILPMILMVCLNAIRDSRRKLSQATSSAFPGRSTSILLSSSSSKNYQQQQQQQPSQHSIISYEEMDKFIRVHRGGSNTGINKLISTNNRNTSTSAPNCCLSELQPQQPQTPISTKKFRRSLNLLKKKALPSKHYEFYYPLSLPIKRAISQYDKHSITSINSRKQTKESCTNLTINLKQNEDNSIIESINNNNNNNYETTSLPPYFRDQCLTWTIHSNNKISAHQIWINRIRRLKNSREHKRSYQSIFLPQHLILLLHLMHKWH